jgi:pyrroline-5-carboxylate reductase
MKGAIGALRKNRPYLSEGRMKGAIGAAAAGSVGSANIIFADADHAKAQAAAKELGASVCAANSEAVRQADYVFLAVKPQVLPAVLGEIAPAVKERLNGARRLVLVSMAAGFPIEKIQALLGFPAPVVRIMPNTPALISQGVIVMTASPEVSAQQSEELEKILAAAGLVDRLPETYFDAVTGLSGSGPAFVYLFIEALSDGGVMAGLPRDKALRYAARTVLGAAAMVEESGRHPGELKDMVASPAGTTIAGIAALEEGAFRGTVMKAVEAAWKRSGALLGA